jgi:hypothetical protein
LHAVLFLAHRFRISLVTFSNNVFVEFPFGFSSSPSVLRSAILAATQEGLSTYLAGALDEVVSSVIDSNRGSRQSLLVYVTNDVSQDDSTTLSTSVSQVLATGTEIIIVAVGDQYSPPELDLISPRQFFVDSFADLLGGYASSLLSSACTAPATTTTTTTTTTTL